LHNGKTAGSRSSNLQRGGNLRIKFCLALFYCGPVGLAVLAWVPCCPGFVVLAVIRGGSGPPCVKCYMVQADGVGLYAVGFPPESGVVVQESTRGNNLDCEAVHFENFVCHVCISLPAFACQMVFMLSGDSPMSARRIAPAAGLSPAAADAVGLAGVWEVRKSLAACGRCCAFNFAGQLLTCPVAIRSVFKVPPRLALCCAVRDVCIIALCCAAVKRFFQVWRIAQQSAGRFGCLAQQSAGPMM